MLLSELTTNLKERFSDVKKYGKVTYQTLIEYEHHLDLIIDDERVLRNYKDKYYVKLTVTNGIPSFQKNLFGMFRFEISDKDGKIHNPRNESQKAISGLCDIELELLNIVENKTTTRLFSNIMHEYELRNELEEYVKTIFKLSKI